MVFEGRRCGACRFMIGAPAALERALPGLNILSSAYGSVRADTGLCERHERFVTCATKACSEYAERIFVQNAAPPRD